MEYKGILFTSSRSMDFDRAFMVLIGIFSTHINRIDVIVYIFGAIPTHKKLNLLMAKLSRRCLALRHGGAAAVGKAVADQRRSLGQPGQEVSRKGAGRRRCLCLDGELIFAGSSKRLVGICFRM